MMTRLQSLLPIIMLVLAGCQADPPVMTDEQGTRPYGHVEMCADPERREKYPEFCEDD